MKNNKTLIIDYPYELRPKIKLSDEAIKELKEKLYEITKDYNIEIITAKAPIYENETEEY